MNQIKMSYSYKVSDLIFFLSIFLPLIGNAQVNPFSYRNTNEIEKLEEFQEWYYTFIGRYQEALKEYDRNRRPSSDRLSKEDSLSFLEWTPVSAKEYILNAAKGYRIIMINEAHHDPRHRAFLNSLLSSLYAQGYTHLGIETLYHTDSLLNKRGYPCLSSGEYLIEPQFGQLVRNAQKLGFTLFPYESTEKLEVPKTKKKKKFDPNSIVRRMDFRDSIQAKNILKVLENNPDSKFIIFAGFGHIAEKKKSGWTTMATNIKKWTGLNPLTIDQVRMTEHGLKVYDEKYFRVARVKEPSVFLKDSIVFVRPMRKGHYDIHVFHPRAKYKYNRPDWIYNKKGIKQIFLKKRKLRKMSFPCVVKAYNCKENIDCAIPVDVIQLDSINEKTSLLLPKGKYEIVMVSESGTQSFKLNVR